MAIGRGLNGSALGFLAAGSAGAANGAASGNVYNLQQFSAATLAVYTASPNAVFNVERSATRNGTFGQFGASLVATGSGITTRTFITQSSAVFHRVTFDNGGGSITYAAMLIGQGARVVPIEQQGNTVNYSDVAA